MTFSSSSNPTHAVASRAVLVVAVPPAGGIGAARGTRSNSTDGAEIDATGTWAWGVLACCGVKDRKSVV